MWFEEIDQIFHWNNEILENGRDWSCWIINDSEREDSYWNQEEGFITLFQMDLIKKALIQNLKAKLKVWKMSVQHKPRKVSREADNTKQCSGVRCRAAILTANRTNAAYICPQCRDLTTGGEPPYHVGSTENTAKQKNNKQTHNEPNHLKKY